jgi:predicted nucleic acid-binding Zn ribbon protein
MDAGEATPFRYEGAMRHAVRSSLCKSGWPWSKADEAAAGVVSEALRKHGATRPTWYEGQSNWADNEPKPSACQLQGCRNPITGNQPKKRYCSSRCQRADGKRQLRLRDPDRGKIARLRSLDRVQKTHPWRDCVYCGSPFQWREEPDQKFCGRQCYFGDKRAQSRRDNPIRLVMQGDPASQKIGRPGHFLTLAVGL